jgi:hypothetical protein
MTDTVTMKPVNACVDGNGMMSIARDRTETTPVIAA